MYEYVQSEKNLWTVGTYNMHGWNPESDHPIEREAAERARYMNGGDTKPSKIIEALKKENIRLSNGTRWLVWDHGQWIVYGKEYRQRNTRTIYSGHDESLAVAHLLYRE